jgi:hypothetical protein
VELTIMRKRLNALRRKYQRMRNDEGLWEQRNHNIHMLKQGMLQQSKKKKITS